jgi:hypothetical protein
VITQNGTTLSSNFSAANQWYFNGAEIPGATAQTYTPTLGGTYRVDVTLSNGCVSQSDNFVYVKQPTGADAGDIGLMVYPNPANNQLNVVFAARANATVALSLVNIAGHAAYSQKETLTVENFSTQINVGNYTPGTYVLKILLDNKLYSRKVIITRK